MIEIIDMKEVVGIIQNRVIILIYNNVPRETKSLNK